MPTIINGSKNLDAVIARLPLNADLNLDTINSNCDTLHAALIQGSESIREAHEALHAVKAEHAEWKDAEGKHGPEFTGDERAKKALKEVESRVERAQIVLDRKRKSQTEISERSKSWGAARAICTNYLEETNGPFEEADFEPFRLESGMTEQEAVVDVVLPGIEGQKTAKKSIDETPVPKPVWMPRAKELVAGLARKGNFTDLLAAKPVGAEIRRLGGGARFPGLTIYEGPEDRHGKSIVDAAAILANAAPELILKWIEQELDEAAARHGGETLDDAQRAKRLAAIHAKRMLLEYQCAQLIWDANDKGIFIPWPRLDARAILGITGPEVRER